MPSATLNVMIKAACQAGRILARDFGEVQNLQSAVQSTDAFVQTTIIRTRGVLAQALRQARPPYGQNILGMPPQPGQDETRWWIVDPLDGVENFRRGLPWFAVSIALARKGTLLAGVVFAPIEGQLFVAENGAGAWLDNHRRLRVSTRARLAEAMLAIAHGPVHALDHSPPHSGLARVVPAGAAPQPAPHIRTINASALTLAWIAAGRFDGLWAPQVAYPTVAAGLVLVQEAGGLATATDVLAPDGQPVPTAPMMPMAPMVPAKNNGGACGCGAVLATNTRLFHPLCRLLNNAPAPAPTPEKTTPDTIKPQHADV